MTEKLATQKWLESVTKKQFAGKSFMDSLKDGTILCEMINKVKLRFVSYNKNPRGIEWMEKENLTTFLSETEKLGVTVIVTIEEIHKGQSEEKFLILLKGLSNVAKANDKYKGPLIGVDGPVEPSALERKPSGKKEYEKVTVVETTNKSLDKETIQAMTKISWGSATKDLKDSGVRSLPPFGAKETSTGSTKKESVQSLKTPVVSGKKEEQLIVSTKKSTVSDDEDDFKPRRDRRKIIDSDDDDDIPTRTISKLEERKRPTFDSDDDDVPIKNSVNKLAGSIVNEKKTSTPEVIPVKKTDPPTPEKKVVETKKSGLSSAEKEQYETRIQLLNDAHDIYVKQLERDHQKQLNHLSHATSPSQEVQDNVRRLSESKVQLEEKMKSSDFQNSELIKNLKKKITELEDEVKRGSASVKNRTKSKGHLSGVDLGDVKKNNLLSDIQLDETDSEMFEEDEDDLEEVSLQKKKDLETDVFKLKSQLMTLEFRARDSRLKESDTIYLIKTLSESLGLKNTTENDGFPLLKEIISKLKDMLLEKEKQLPEFDSIGSDIIDFTHSIVSEFTSLDAGLKEFEQKTEVLKTPRPEVDDEEMDLKTMLGTLRRQNTTGKMEMTPSSLQLPKRDSFKEVEKRFSTLNFRRFNTSQFPQKAYQSSEISKDVMAVMTLKFKCYHPDGGLLDKTKYFQVNQFTKKILLLDKKGNIRKEMDGAQVLFLDKNIFDSKRIRIAFLSGPEYELVFSTIEDRERFYECVSATRQTICWSPWMTSEKSEVSAVVIHDKQGTVHIEASFDRFESIKVYCGTWNMGAHPPPINYRGFDELFPEDMDLIAISFQESDSGISKYVLEYFERNYFPIVSLVLWEIRLVVLAKTEHYSKITSIQSGSKATGFMNMLGNKGGVGVSFKFNETYLCFVGTHLAAHEERITQRNQNVTEIVQNLKLGNPDLDSVQFDHVFWMGDMNYRIDLPYSRGLKYAQEKNFKKLVETDQLHKEIESGSVFTGYKEGEITFPPSYKFDLGSRKYTLKKARTPSYCDRVIYKSATQAKIKQLSYVSPTSLTTSDHSPVYATFEVQTLRPILSFLGETRPRIVVLDDIFISGRSGTLIKQPQLTMYGTFLSESPQHSKKVPAKKTANPSFGSYPYNTHCDIIKFEPEYLKTQHLVFMLKDLSLGTKTEDIVIGYASVSLEMACEDTPLEFSVPLTLSTKQIGFVNGTCHVKVRNMMM